MKKHTPNRKRHSAFEQLETRQMLSSSLNAGILTITGGIGQDTVTVTVVGTNYVVAEQGLPNKNYNFAAVGEIIANLNGGNDIYGMQSTITIPASVSGGSGNDFIFGGGGKDSLIGGAGNDSLFGSLNNDQLSGGDGNDSLVGNAGVDALVGGNNDDRLDGSLGNDFMDGGAGNDTVSYANRSVPVIAHLDTDYANAPKQVKGGGGVSGELDQYTNVENIVGGSSAETLSYHAKSAPVDSNFSIPLSLDGAAGNDTIKSDSFGGGGQPLDFKYSIVTEIGGAGNDKLLHDHAVSTKMIGGDGDDEVNQIFDPFATPPISFDGGAGHDQWFDGSSDGSPYTLDMSHSVEDLFATSSNGTTVTIKGNGSANT